MRLRENKYGKISKHQGKKFSYFTQSVIKVGTLVENTMQTETSSVTGDIETINKCIC